MTTLVRGGASSRYRVASGAAVTISSAVGDLREPWFGRFWLRSARVYRAFETAPAGTFETHAGALLGVGVAERLAVRSGELLLAHDPETHGSLAAWRGRWHDVCTWIRGPRPDSQRLVEIFSDVVLEDGASGPSARPRLPAQTKLYGVEVKKWIPGIAYLTVLDGADAVDLVPRWAGAQAGAGEVWRKTLERGRDLFVHASRSAVTLALPQEPTDAAARRTLEFLDDAAVTWG